MKRTQNLGLKALLNTGSFGNSVTQGDNCNNKIVATLYWPLGPYQTFDWHSMYIISLNIHSNFQELLLILLIGEWS